MHKVAALTLLAGSVILAGLTHAIAEEDRRHGGQEDSPKVAQVVALDECDPQTFNPALGEEGTGFCHNVTLYGLGLGFETPLDMLVGEANSGTPDPSWDFEPDVVEPDRGALERLLAQRAHGFPKRAQIDWCRSVDRLDPDIYRVYPVLHQVDTRYLCAPLQPRRVGATRGGINNQHHPGRRALKELGGLVKYDGPIWVDGRLTTIGVEAVQDDLLFGR
jgi:hypothetical protein